MGPIPKVRTVGIAAVILLAPLATRIMDWSQMTVFYRKKRIIECFSFLEKLTRRSLLDLSNAGVEPRYPIAIHGHFDLPCSHRRSGSGTKTGMRKTFPKRGIRSSNPSACRGSATEIYAWDHPFWSAILALTCRDTAIG